MVGRSGARAAVMGAMPNNADTDTEVQAFVASLVEHRRIAFPKSGRAAAVASSYPQHTTHEIKSVGGKKVLQRVRFACTCHPAGRFAFAT